MLELGAGGQPECENESTTKNTCVAGRAERPRTLSRRRKTESRRCICLLNGSTALQEIRKSARNFERTRILDAALK